MGLVARKPDFVVWENQRRRPACAFAQTAGDKNSTRPRYNE